MSSTRRAPSKWLTLAAACLGLGMLMVDLFVVNVALPAISRDLATGLAAAEWTVSGYVLAIGVLPLITGRLGDIFGRRRVYLFGLNLFILASAACGAAQSIEQLVIARLFQGVGAAVMQPGTLSIIVQAFPPYQRGTAIGIWGGVSGLGLIAGPVLGGLLVRGDQWRGVFLVNLPVGALALLMALRFVSESRDPSAPRTVDWPGAMALAGGLALIMLGLTRATSVGWVAPDVIACFAGGALLLVLFVGIERWVRAPLVDLSLFRSGTFVMACLTGFLFSAAVFGAQPYTSLFMQHYWGLSPLGGGIAFVPSTALVALFMVVSGFLGQWLGSRLRLVVIAGALAVTASFLLVLPLDVGSRYWDGLFVPFLLRGAGIGLVMASLSLAVVSAVPLTKSGLASGTLTMARNIGTSLGVAVLGAVFLHHVDTAMPQRLAPLPPAQAVQMTAAAEHFLPAGEGETYRIASEVIVDGFVLLALVSALMSAVAAGAALFIRHRAPGAQLQPVIVETAEHGPLPSVRRPEGAAGA